MTTTAIERTADFPLSAGFRRVVVRFRNPSRLFAIQVPNDPWTLSDVPVRYRPMIEAVLDNAAESILRAHIESFTTVPSFIDQGLFTEPALIDAATSSNSTWLSKEELSDLWKASATRRKFYGDARYSSSKPYRQAVAKFEELVLKLSGKSVKIDPDQLDTILVKIAQEDLETELGAFICKRIETLKNKPTAEAVSLDLL